jgi:hypothetical protein
MDIYVSRTQIQSFGRYYEKGFETGCQGFLTTGHVTNKASGRHFHGITPYVGISIKDYQKHKIGTTG